MSVAGDSNARKMQIFSSRFTELVILIQEEH